MPTGAIASSLEARRASAFFATAAPLPSFSGPKPAVVVDSTSHGLHSDFPSSSAYVSMPHF